MKEETKILIGVYGTLKKDFMNHKYLEGYGVQYKKDGTIQGILYLDDKCFPRFKNFAYPGFNVSVWTKVEVYSVPLSTFCFLNNQLEVPYGYRPISMYCQEINKWIVIWETLEFSEKWRTCGGIDELMEY